MSSCGRKKDLPEASAVKGARDKVLGSVGMMGYDLEFL